MITEPVLRELKHSIQTHVAIFGGPSQQLAAFLLKLVDLLEDADAERREREAANLAYLIVEGAAVHVCQAVAAKAAKLVEKQQPFPPRVKQAGDNILIGIGSTRNLPDKTAAKNTLLRSVAAALRELQTVTKATYPTITDSQRQPL